MSTKPVDLIVANTMYEAVDQIAIVERLQTAAKKAKVDLSFFGPMCDEVIARRLLSEIANQASLKTVFLALSAVNAPSSVELIKEGLQAVMDRRQA